MCFFKKLLPKKFTKQHLFLLLVLLIASFLRLYNVANTVQFLGDQGRDAMVVASIFKELDPVFIGPVTSVGNMYLGPLYYYFMVPFLMLTYPSPMGPVYAMALLGIITVFLMYYLGKQFLSERVALIGATLFGLSMVVAQNTRFSWNPNPAPLVSLLMMFFIHKSLKKDVKYWIGVVVCFAILIQLHYLTLLSGASFGIIWLYQLANKIKNKKSIKKMLVSSFIGAMIFFASLTPLILFDIKHDGLNRNAFLSILTQEETFAKKEHQVSTIIVNTAGNIRNRVSLIVTDLSIGENNKTINTIISFTFLIVLFYILVKKSKKDKKGKTIKIAEGEFIIFTFLIVGVLGTALYKHEVYYHYIGYLFPAIFLLFGIVLDYLWSLKFKGKQIFIGKVFVVLFLILFLRFNYNHGKLILKPLGWSIANIQSVAQTIEDRVAPGEKYNIVLLNGTGDLNGQNYRYFLLTSDDKKIVKEDEFRTIETLFIIDEERKIEKEVDSPVYEIVTFPNKEPAEVYYIPDGPEITVLRKNSN